MVRTRLICFDRFQQFYFVFDRSHVRTFSFSDPPFVRILVVIFAHTNQDLPVEGLPTQDLMDFCVATDLNSVLQCPLDDKEHPAIFISSAGISSGVEENVE